jgi:hypothetical protein
MLDSNTLKQLQQAPIEERIQIIELLLQLTNNIHRPIRPSTD